MPLIFMIWDHRGTGGRWWQGARGKTKRGRGGGRTGGDEKH